jgi:uncharacterized membrane protein
VNQDEVNQAEWKNPDNWRGGWLGIYVAPRDTRDWVPKRIPWMGWTLNFAHGRSWLWLGALLVGPLIVMLVLARYLR